MPSGGDSIPDASTKDYDFTRLERAVDGLLRRYVKLGRENAEARRRLSDRDQRVRTLEAQLRDANQKRQDAIKRLDDLIAKMEQLDAQLGGD